jgi:hypothetical protein
MGAAMYGTLEPFWTAILTGAMQMRRWLTIAEILPVGTPFEVEALTEDQTYDLWQTNIQQHPRGI